MKKRMNRKMLALFMVLVMAVSVLAGCGGSDKETKAETQAKSEVTEGVETKDAGTKGTEAKEEGNTAAAGDGERWVVGLEYSASSCEFCQKFADECKRYGEEKGFEVLLTQGNRSVSNQITNAEGMLAQDAKIIGGFWDDPDACMTIKDACEAQDVWCIGVLCPLTDRGNNYDKYRFVGSENYNAGLLNGEYAAEKLPENAKVLELHGLTTDPQDQGRFGGFKDALEKAGRTDVEVLDAQYLINQTREEALKITENWLQVYPDDVDAIISYSDEYTIAVVEALRSAGLNGKVQVYSFDGSNEACAMIQTGDITADVLQDYKKQADAYIDLCVNIRDTGTSEDMDVPFTLITPDNAEEYLHY